MGKVEEKAVLAQEKEKGPAVNMGRKGHNINDKFPEQEILWESFKATIQGTPDREGTEYRENENDCRRCARGG